MIYDVIVVGAGPGGSSAAAFFAEHGLAVLLLDKAAFPRDKVCGDGLTPQAIVWLDILGCLDAVLRRARSCITSADLFVDGRHVVTARFPQDGRYPGFGVCVERKTLDDLLVRHAVSRGAVFRPRHAVSRVIPLQDCIAVKAQTPSGTLSFTGRLIIGADGANSIVSRSIGNRLKDGTMVLSMRRYYEGVTRPGSPVAFYFSERFFPGYGWAFVDDWGRANVGFGYVADSRFPMKRDLARLFDEFTRIELRDLLSAASPADRPGGWWCSFARPSRLVADRVMLVGDAARAADPMNGAGIHAAIETAYHAAGVGVRALATGDCSERDLSIYERLWKETAEPDWQIGDLFLSLVKNPALVRVYFALLKGLGAIAEADQGVKDFFSGVFSGVIPHRACLSPTALASALPLSPGAWMAALSGQRLRPSSLARAAASAASGAWDVAGRAAANPAANLSWGLEVVEKAARVFGGAARPWHRTSQ